MFAHADAPIAALLRRIARDKLSRIADGGTLP